MLFSIPASCRIMMWILCVCGKSTASHAGCHSCSAVHICWVWNHNGWNFYSHWRFAEEKMASSVKAPACYWGIDATRSTFFNHSSNPDRISAPWIWSKRLRKHMGQLTWPLTTFRCINERWCFFWLYRNCITYVSCMFLCTVSSPLVDMSCIYVSSPGFQLLVFFIFFGTYWNGIVYGYVMMFLNCNKMFFSPKKDGTKIWINFHLCLHYFSVHLVL